MGSNVLNTEKPAFRSTASLNITNSRRAPTDTIALSDSCTGREAHSTLPMRSSLDSSGWPLDGVSLPVHPERVLVLRSVSSISQSLVHGTLFQRFPAMTGPAQLRPTWSTYFLGEENT